MDNNWVDIIDYDFKYQINEEGIVRRFTEKCPHCNKWFNVIYIAGVVANTGYRTVALRKKGKFKHLLLHRLLTKAFIPNPNNKPEVNHKDYNKTNNNLSNLEWVTRSENQYHAMRKKGRKYSMFNKNKIGGLSYCSKTVFQFTKEGEFIKQWGATMDIQRKLGINNSHISKCCLGKNSHAGGYVWRYNKAFEILTDRLNK